jgi:hypothetical protein
LLSAHIQRLADPLSKKRGQNLSTIFAGKETADLEAERQTGSAAGSDCAMLEHSAAPGGVMSRVNSAIAEPWQDDRDLARMLTGL